MTAIPPSEFWPIAAKVCTDKELEVLSYMSRGYGYRRIAKILGISDEAVRGRRIRAGRKISKALAEKEAA